MRWVLAVLVLMGCGRTEPVRYSRDAGLSDVNCPIAVDARVSATLGITADDQRTVWLNGALIANTGAMWFEPSTHEVEVFTHPARKNVLAVLATNLQTIPSLDRGLLASLRVGPGVLITDASWRFAPDELTVIDWVTSGFDDASWGHPVEEAINGAQPWGPFADIDPRARWLWPYNSATTDKPGVEPVRFRRAFYVLLDGGISDAPGECP